MHKPLHGTADFRCGGATGEKHLAKAQPFESAGDSGLIVGDWNRKHRNTSGERLKYRVEPSMRDNQ